MDTLARFRLRAEARRFGLGYLWWVLEPLLYVGVFYLVFVLFLGNREPGFLFFLAVGKLTFIWFSKTINQAALSLLHSREIMAQTNLPKHLFPMAVIHEGLYRQGAVFVFLLICTKTDSRKKRPNSTNAYFEFGCVSYRLKN